MRIFILCLFLLFSIGTHAQWQAIDSSALGSYTEVEFINADTGFVYTSAYAALITTDGGLTWDTVGMTFTGFIEDIEFSSSQVGYAGGGAWFPHGTHYGNALLKTTDGGNTWDSIMGSYNHGLFHDLEVLSDQEFFAVQEMFVVHSNDGGANIDTLEISAQPEAYREVEFISPQEGFILADVPLGSGQFYFNLLHTTDGGQNWQSIYTDTAEGYARTLVMTPSGHGLIAGGKGSLMRTTDGGANWQKLPVDSSMYFLQFEYRNGELYTVGQDLADTTTRIYHSSDWGLNWNRQFSMSSTLGNIGRISIPTSQTGYFTFDNKLYKNDQLISLRENAASGNFQIFPNPATDHLEVILPEGAAFTRFLIVNTAGEVVKELELPSEGKHPFDLSGLPEGLYYLVIHDDNAPRSSRAFVIQR